MLKKEIKTRCTSIRLSKSEHDELSRLGGGSIANGVRSLLQGDNKTLNDTLERAVHELHGLSISTQPRMVRVKLRGCVEIWLNPAHVSSVGTPKGKLQTRIVMSNGRVHWSTELEDKLTDRLLWLED